MRRLCVGVALVAACGAVAVSGSAVDQAGGAPTGGVFAAGTWSNGGVVDGAAFAYDGDEPYGFDVVGPNGYRNGFGGPNHRLPGTPAGRFVAWLPLKNPGGKWSVERAGPRVAEFTIDASNVLGRVDITRVVASSSTVTFDWTAPNEARSFLVLLIDSAAPGILPSYAYRIVPASARSVTFTGLSLMENTQYAAVIEGFTSDIASSAPIASPFNVSGAKRDFTISDTPTTQPPSPLPACSITQNKSIVGEVATTIVFLNATAGPVRVYWLNYSGVRVLYKTLEEGESYTQHTYKTHAWVALDSSGRCVGYSVSSAATDTYVIGEDSGAGKVLGASKDCGGYPSAWCNMPCSHDPYLTEGRCKGNDWGRTREGAQDTTFSDFGYGYRNCTDYVAWRLIKQDEVPATLVKGLRDGGNWAANARGRGIKVNSAPAVGSAVSFAGTTGNPAGHIAYVAQVLSDGSIKVDEFNQKLTGNYSSGRVIAAATAKTLEYIHFEMHRPPKAVPPKPAPPQQPAQPPLSARANGKVVSVTQNGTSYTFDGRVGPGLHWIPDKETYWCRVLRYGQRVLTVATQAEANSLGNGQPWEPRCFAKERVRNKVVREAGGTAYFVSADDRWHWIPTGALYNCLIARYPLINGSPWQQINSLRGANGENEGKRIATCGTGGGGAGW